MSIESKSEIAVIGQTNFRSSSVKFGIKEDDRRRHMYFLGKTGMGKSTLMQYMMIQDILNGKGLGIIDPHGDSAELMLQYIPKHRIKDVVYFNPSDIDFPFAFNIFEMVNDAERHLVASGLLGVFKKLWAESWGPRLEYLLNNAIMALLEYPGSTILGVMRILVDKEYRKEVVDYISDPVIKSFWVNEYAKYPDRFQQEAIAPIQNKVGRFLSSPMMRNIIGQVNSSISIREVIDGNKILIMNLSKGRIGEDNSALLGAMMITKIQLAAMSRVNVLENERKDFYLYVDEFQNFSTESFANILSEARKYRLDLVLAHQYITQLDEKVAAAIFGNVGTMCIFRIGADDAEALLKEFAPQFDENDLVNIPKYHCLMKLMIDGISSEPFLASTIRLPEVREGQHLIAEEIIRYSREQYAVPRAIVEEKIATWSGLVGGDKPRPYANKDEVVVNDQAVTPRYEPRQTNNSPVSNNQTFVNNEKPSPKLNKANCDECGVEVLVPFVPDPARKIYCKDCLTKERTKKSQKVEQLKTSLPPLPPMVSLKSALTSAPVSFNGGDHGSHKNNIKKEEPVSLNSLKSNNHNAPLPTQRQVMPNVGNNPIPPRPASPVIPMKNLNIERQVVKPTPAPINNMPTPVPQNHSQSDQGSNFQTLQPGTVVKFDDK